MSTARELVGQVRELPSLPIVYFRVKSVIEWPDSSVADVAKEICLVMFLLLPHESERALRHSLDSERPLYSVEREMIGFDYAEVGAALVERWHLSRNMEVAIRHHAEPLLAGDMAAEASVLHLATLFADAAFKTERHEIWNPQVDPRIWAHARVFVESFARIRELADSEFESLAQAILPACAPRPMPRVNSRISHAGRRFAREFA